MFVNKKIKKNFLYNMGPHSFVFLFYVYKHLQFYTTKWKNSAKHEAALCRYSH